MTPLQAEHSATFDTLASQGIVVLKTLQTQLDIELQALQQRDLNALQQSTATRQQLLEQFAHLNTQRKQLLTGLGISDSPAGISQWFEGLPGGLRPAAEAIWQEQQQVLEQITLLNRRNEQVLRHNNRNTEQLLTLLRGQNPRNTLYDAAGSKGQASAQTRLGKA